MDSQIVPQNVIPAGPYLALDDIHLEPRRPLIDLRYVAAAVRANLWLIAAMIATALTIALIATLITTKRYTATASVQINDQSQRVLGNEIETEPLANNGWDTDRFLQTELDVLKSRAIAERVMTRLQLQGNATFYAQMEATAPGPNAPSAAVRETTLALLRGNMAAKLPRNSRIATITFESTDAALSARIANAYAEEFIQASLQQRYDSSAYARSFISGQLQDVKLRLEESERDLNNYARQVGLIRPRQGSAAIAHEPAGPGSASIIAASLTQVNSAASEARVRRIAAEGRVRSLTAKPLLVDREALQNPAVQALFTQRAEVEARLQEELTRRLDGHPAVQQLRAQLAALDSQLNQAAQNMRSAAMADYEAALATETKLFAEVEALKAATLSEQDRAVQYNLLEREADTNRALYDGLLQRYKELNASAGISTSNIAIIDRASPPIQASSPNLMKNIAFALLGGLGFAALATFLRSQFDQIIRVPEDIENKLRLALLGVVPRTHKASLRDELNDPKSAISESYNSLCSALLYSTSKGLPPTLLVSSAQPSEGKTTTSCELARGFARMGRRVLLVDVDLRRPGIHQQFSLDNATGLSTLLTQQEGLDQVIRNSGQDRLDIVCSGPVPPSPSELIAAERMAQLMGEMTACYDVVIFDSPPILGLADAPLISALVDGVVFIVESDRGRHGSLKTSLGRLRAMRPNILGAVLTKFDPTKAAHRYSEYSDYEDDRFKVGRRDTR